MKNYFFILSIIVLGLLPSCYDSNYVETDRITPELKTCEAIVQKNKIYLYGESSIKSPILFFQISQSKTFEESETKTVSASYEFDSTPNVYAELNGLIEPGTHYIRLCARVSKDSETIMADNIVGIVTENPIKTLEPQKITENSVVLYGTYEGSQSEYTNNKYFEVSTDPEFKECTIYDKPTSHKMEDGSIVFEKSINNLLPSMEYYVRFYVTDNVGSHKVKVTGNVLKFNTKKGALLNVKKITCPNTSYKLDLIVNPQGTKDYVRGVLKYDEKNGSYILENNIILLPDIKYNVYLINASGAGLSYINTNGLSLAAQFTDNGGYRIFYANCIVDVDNPFVSLEARELTCEVTFKFSVGSGNIPMEIISDKETLPHGYLNLETGSFLNTAWFWGSGIFYNGHPLYLIPFEIENDGDATIEVSTPRGYYKYKMSRVKMESGKKYLFIDGVLSKEDQDLDISDVSVKPWDATDGGSIIINP